MKQCHICNKELKRPFEKLFNHCYECGLKRLENLQYDFEPCEFCRNRKQPSGGNDVM